MSEVHCLVKIAHKIYDVPRDVVDTLEAEGLVELVDDGAAISGYFVPRRGVRVPAVRRRLQQISTMEIYDAQSPRPDAYGADQDGGE